MLIESKAYLENSTIGWNKKTADSNVGSDFFFFPLAMGRSAARIS